MGVLWLPLMKSEGNSQWKSAICTGAPSFPGPTGKHKQLPMYQMLQSTGTKNLFQLLGFYWWEVNGCYL